LPRDASALPPPPEALWQVADDGLRALGIDLSAPARAAIDAHLRLLLAWNEHVNLTALRDPEQIARGHVVDSLSALPLIARLATRAAAPAGTNGAAPQRPSIVDIGSGGGFPGLPLAVALPAGRCALVDSVAKKARFLEAAAAASLQALGANGHSDPPTIEVLAERAEDLADDPAQRAAWDVVVVRAVGSLAEVVELGLPLARVGGHVVAWKREMEEAGLRDEINPTRRLLQAAGGSRPTVVAPDRDGRAGLANHRLVTVRKTRATPDRYPRTPAERRRAMLLR
jgi:16S rRNA (guanine527-N7)-methyltransferase